MISAIKKSTTKMQIKVLLKIKKRLMKIANKADLASSQSHMALEEIDEILTAMESKEDYESYGSS